MDAQTKLILERIGNLEKQNKQLTERVEKLEKQLTELKSAAPYYAGQAYLDVGP